MKMYVFYCLNNYNIVYTNSLNPFSDPNHIIVDEEYKEHYGFAEVEPFWNEPGLYRYNLESGEAEFVDAFENINMDEEMSCGDCPDLSTFVRYNIKEFDIS